MLRTVAASCARSAALHPDNKLEKWDLETLNLLWRHSLTLFPIQSSISSDVQQLQP